MKDKAKSEGARARDKYQVRALLSFPSNEAEREGEGGRGAGVQPVGALQSRLLGSA